MGASPRQGRIKAIKVDRTVSDLALGIAHERQSAMIISMITAPNNLENHLFKAVHLHPAGFEIKPTSTSFLNNQQ